MLVYHSALLPGATLFEAVDVAFAGRGEPLALTGSSSPVLKRGSIAHRAETAVSCGAVPSAAARHRFHFAEVGAKIALAGVAGLIGFGARASSEDQMRCPSPVPTPPRYPPAPASQAFVDKSISDPASGCLPINWIDAPR